MTGPTVGKIFGGKACLPESLVPLVGDNPDDYPALSPDSHRTPPELLVQRLARGVAVTL